MSLIKRVDIKESPTSTPVSYEVAGEAQNITVSYDDQGKIIEDIGQTTPTSTKSVAKALKDHDNVFDTLGTAATKDVAVSGDASTNQVVMGNDTRLSDSRPASDVSAWAKADTKPNYTAAEVGAIPSSEKGAINGVAELDSSGKIPSSQLPSYVDDVKEYNSRNDFPEIGEADKIYIALDTNLTYRWGGSEYVAISSPLALGETSSSAYRGDRGKIAYDHASDSSKLGTATVAGLYKVGSTLEGHIASLDPVTKTDITGLGIPAQDTTYNVVSKTENGLVPQLPNETTTVKYLRQDGTWNKPDTLEYQEVTQAQYDALTPEEKQNGTIYLITDAAGSGNISDYDVEFTSEDDGTDTSAVTMPITSSPKKLSSLMNILSTAVKNIRYLFKNKQDAATAINTSNIGDQSVTYATTAGSATDNTKLPLTGGTLTGALTTRSDTADDIIEAATNGHSRALQIKGRGTASALAYGLLYLGNSTASGTAGNSQGILRIYGGDTAYSNIYSSAKSNRNQVLPDKAGTFAMTSDLDDYLPLIGGTLTGNLSVNRSDGTTSSIGFSKLSVGNTKASGTDKNSRGQVQIYGTSAYYGVLQVGANTAHRTYTLPDANGTIALTSNLSSYLPLEGGTMTGAINFANGVWNKFGDDVYIGDANVEGSLCILGISGETGIYFKSKNKTYSSRIRFLDGRTLQIGRGNTQDIAFCGTKGIMYSTDGNSYTSLNASAFNTVSSKLIKTNIVSITEEKANALLKLEPVTFDFINGEKNRHGLIAEDAYKILPEIVSVPEGYNMDDDEGNAKRLAEDFTIAIPSIDYSSIVPYLIKLVQIQNERINKLEEIISKK